MNYKYVKPLTSPSLITEFERKTGFFLPYSFKTLVRKNNGGRPEKTVIKTPEREICLKTFLSFNKNDKETIWNSIEWNEGVYYGKHIPFATDNFGNTFCFSSNADETDTIVFIDHETNQIITLANSFKEFLNKLSC